MVQGFIGHVKKKDKESAFEVVVKRKFGIKHQKESLKDVLLGTLM
jgi:hypothetical protein